MFKTFVELAFERFGGLFKLLILLLGPKVDPESKILSIQHIV